MNKQEISHTPGPWEVFDSYTGQYVLDCAEQAVVCQLDWGLESEANARLIASAPEVLAALKRLLSNVIVCYDVGVLREARAAIDKAEGRVEG